MKANPYFAAMLDCSRNAVKNVEAVKGYARLFKAIGYNAILLYTEDTYEVEGEPYFGYQRGRYSIKEIQEMDAYCQSIGLQLIPCIETLAHLNQIFRWSDYASICDENDVLLVADKRTEELLEHMFASLRKAYSSPYIHIGMDEAFSLGKGKYRALHGSRPQMSVFAEHLSLVLRIAGKYGFTPLMWSDMFFNKETLSYYKEKGSLPKAVKDSIPKGVDLVAWHYGNPWRKGHLTDTKEDFLDLLQAHKAVGNGLWYAGGLWNWIGFSPSYDFAYETMKHAMEAAREEGIQNIIMTSWDDDGAECSPLSVLELFFASREIYLGNEDLDLIKRKFAEKTGENYDDFALIGHLNSLNTPDVPFIQNLTKWATYDDPFLCLFLNREGKEDPKKYLEAALSLEEASRRSKYPLLFKEQSALARFLSFKMDLGIMTYRAYQAKDKRLIEALLGRYKAAEEAGRSFYEAFRALWYSENKGQGFEVMDIRLGGLLQRIDSCRRRLEDYLSGSIGAIEELEYEPLDVNGESNPEQGLFYCSWILTASRSRIG